MAGVQDHLVQVAVFVVEQRHRKRRVILNGIPGQAAIQHLPERIEVVGAVFAAGTGLQAFGRNEAQSSAQAQRLRYRTHQADVGKLGFKRIKLGHRKIMVDYDSLHNFMTNGTAVRSGGEA